MEKSAGIGGELLQRTDTASLILLLTKNYYGVNINDVLVINDSSGYCPLQYLFGILIKGRWRSKKSFFYLFVFV